MADKEKDFQHVKEWLLNRPSDSDISCFMILVFLNSRGAYSEETCVSESEMDNLGKHMEGIFTDLTLLEMIVSGDITADFSEGDPSYVLTAQGQERAASN